jgi:G3E family GTPase
MYKCYIEEDSEDEEDEDEEVLAQKIQEAREKLKSERAKGLEKQTSGVFKDLLRSKGSIWLSNKPQHFFEWSQASVEQSIGIGGPWVCTLTGISLADQAKNKNIGDRA